MKKTLLSLTVAAMAAVSAQAQIAGDIFIIGYRADATDAIAFVPWIDLANGASISFTDAGFFSDGTLRDSEDIMTWTNSTGSSILAGTVITVTGPDDGSAVVNIGSAVGKLNGLSASGDQIFAGTTAFPDTGDTSAPGSTYTGTLLFGLDLNGTAGWDVTASNSNTSALPGALASANVSFAHFDNGQYTGPRTGLTIEQYKTAILDVDNWTFNDDGASFGSLDSTAFTAVPEPRVYALATVALITMIVFLKRDRRRAG